MHQALQAVTYLGSNWVILSGANGDQFEIHLKEFATRFWCCSPFLMRKKIQTHWVKLGMHGKYGRGCLPEKTDFANPRKKSNRVLNLK